MVRPELPLDPSAGPVEKFACELRQLRARAGNPTYRAIVHRVNYSCSYTTPAAASGKTPPTAG